METLIVGALCSLIAYIVGLFSRGFLPSYMKEKGKNLATKEDIQELSAQTAILTQTAKEIESKISDAMWNKQRQWEMKRDALVAALQAVTRADDEVMRVALAYTHGKAEGEKSQAEWKDTKLETTLVWHDAMNDFDSKCVMVELVCQRATIDALRLSSKTIRLAATRILEDTANGYDEISPAIQKARVDAFAVARKELGIAAE